MSDSESLNIVLPKHAFFKEPMPALPCPSLLFSSLCFPPLSISSSFWVFQALTPYSSFVLREAELLFSNVRINFVV